jgi:hypothetical protein
MADEDAAGPSTFFPLRAREGLSLFAIMLQNILLLSFFLGMNAVKYCDKAITYVTRHWAISALFQGWTILVLASYMGLVTPSLFQSIWFQQVDALLWLIRTTELCWTFPRLVVHISFWLLKEKSWLSIAEVKSYIQNVKIRSVMTSKATRTVVFTSFTDVKQIVYIAVGLYWVFRVPLASAGTTTCPMFTEKMGAGRWFHFYAAFRAYLIRQDIYMFDEKEPRNLVTAYPEEGATVSKQKLSDLKVNSAAVFMCTDMKALSLLIEATSGYPAVNMTATSSDTYAEAIVAIQLMLMGQRESTIALHRRKVDSGFGLMEMHPKSIAEYWVGITVSVTALRDFGSPISDSELRTRLLQVCDMHQAFNDIRAKSIFEPTFCTNPADLVTVMKEFVIRLKEEDEPDQHSASSSRSQSVRQPRQNTWEPENKMIDCHRCGDRVEWKNIRMHRQSASCKCPTPCAKCGKDHLTKMHDAFIDHQKRYNERNSHQKPTYQDGKTRYQQHPTARTSSSTASVAREDTSTASTDFFLDSTPAYFYGCSALQPDDFKVNEPSQPQFVVLPAQPTVKSLKCRILRVTAGLCAISALGMVTKSPCRSIYSEQVCTWASASATALLLYSSMEEGHSQIAVQQMSPLQMSTSSALVDQYDTQAVDDILQVNSNSDLKLQMDPDSNYEVFKSSVAMSSNAADTSGSALLDTACWNHLSGESSYFINIRNPPHDFQATTTACGTTVRPEHIGDIPIVFKDKSGELVPILLRNCMFMRGFPEKLLMSEGQLSELVSATGDSLFQWDPTETTIAFRRDLGDDVSPWRNIQYNKGRVSMVPYVAAGQNALSLMETINAAQEAAREALTAENAEELIACATTPRSVKISPMVFHHRMACTHSKSLRRVLHRTRGIILNDNLSKLRSPHSQAALNGMARKSDKPRQSIHAEQSVQRNHADLRYETANIDVHGPYEKSVLGEYRYFVSLTTKPSSFSYVHFSKAPNCVQEALQRSFLDIGRPLTIRTDTNVHITNSNPNNPTEFQKWLNEEEIGLKLSAPGAQYENGVAEKAGGQDIYGHATALLTHAGISEKWWPFAVLNFVRIKNNIPQSSDLPTPLEEHYGVIPWIGHFRVPFCPAFAHLDKAKRGPTPNFRSRVTECMYLGPAIRHKPGTDLLFSFRTKRLIVTRDVIFDEEFKFVDRVEGGWKFQCGLLVDHDGNKVDLVDVDDEVDFYGVFEDLSSYNQAIIPRSQQATFLEDVLFAPAEKMTSITVDQTAPQPVDASEDSAENDDSDTSSDTSDEVIPAASKKKTRSSVREEVLPVRSRRTIKAPKRLTFDMGNPINHPSEFAGSMTPLSTDSDLLLQALLHSDHVDDYVATQKSQSSSYWSRQFTEVGNAITDFPQQKDPPIAASAMSSSLKLRPPFTAQIKPIWHLCDRRFKSFAHLYGLAETQRAYLKELQGIIDAGVFSELVRLPKGHQALPLMSLPTYKIQEEGCVKYRIVAGGNLQKEGQSFQLEDLPAPVMDRISFRIFMCIATTHHCFIHTLDITQAFLNADMTDEVYVRPSKEMGVPSGWFWRLLKALYGCRQSPALWYASFKEFLLSQGLVPTVADTCMFIMRIPNSGHFLMCGLHSDDLIMAATNMELMTSFKTAIMKQYKLRDQGDINGREYLGLLIHYNREIGWAHISCDRAITNMLEQHGLGQIQPKTTPALKRSIRDDTLASESSSTHNIDMPAFLGGCNYIATACRPDVATIVSIMSSMDKMKPTVSDVDDALWLAGYLNNMKANPNYGIHFSASSSSIIEQLIPQSYADADWAGAPSSARSRSGAYVALLGGPIYWKSQFQKVIALSSTHSEIIALSDLCKRLVWILALLNELGFQIPLAPVWEDNQASLINIKNPTTSERSRHIEIRYLWTRQLHECKICFFKWIDSKYNIADHFTKIEAANIQRGFINKMCTAIRP